MAALHPAALQRPGAFLAVRRLESAAQSLRGRGGLPCAMEQDFPKRGANARPAGHLKILFYLLLERLPQEERGMPLNLFSIIQRYLGPLQSRSGSREKAQPAGLHCNNQARCSNPGRNYRLFLQACDLVVDFSDLYFSEFV